MKSKYLFLKVIALPFIFQSCISPVNLTYDRAKTLGKGNFEVNGNYSWYSKSQDNNSNPTNENFGGRIGYGISNDVDLKVRYERIISDYESDPGVNYLSIFPKISLVKNTLSIIVPFSAYFTEAIIDDQSRYTVAPELIGTHPFSKNADLSLMVKGEYLFGDENNTDDFYAGIKVGMGFSSDIDKWAIRPEGGLLINPGVSAEYWSYGLSVVYYLGKSK